jgi:carbon monoxide dehydrogenase subunit G
VKVELEKVFLMPGSAETAWALLKEIERVTGCVPGAKITERIDDQNYKGTISVKFGPASMSFRGDVEVKLVDPATRTLRIVGKGTDTTGSSGASMDLTARVDAGDATTCNLVGNSEVSLSGKAAAFGARMMSSVADQVLKQFADNFAAQVKAQTPAPPVDSGAGTTAAPAPAATVAPVPTQLNALALAWAIIKDWFRSLFATKKA